MHFNVAVWGLEEGLLCITLLCYQCLAAPKYFLSKDSPYYTALHPPPNFHCSKVSAIAFLRVQETEAFSRSEQVALAKLVNKHQLG